MKRIAYLINSIHHGGPSSVVRNIINNLNPKQYKVYLITLFNDGNDEIILDELRTRGVTTIDFGFSSRKKALVSGSSCLTKCLVENSINIVHSHGFIPDIISARSTAKVKRVSTIHCNLFEDYAEVYGKYKGLLYAFVQLWYLRKLDNPVCCSESVFNVLKKYIPNASFIRNGVESLPLPNPSVTRVELGIPEDAYIYIYVGQLRPRKDVPGLMRMFIENHKPNEFILVIGKGSEEQKCKELAAEDSNIRFIGYSKNVSAFLGIADVYMSASVSEGFSISVLEALGEGLGLFLSAIPSHSETFTISEQIKLGTTFTKETITKDWEKLRRIYPEIDRQKIVVFKEKYLSAKSMTDSYELIYDG